MKRMNSIEKVMASCERVFGREKCLLGYMLNSYSLCLLHMSRKRKLGKWRGSQKTVDAKAFLNTSATT